MEVELEEIELGLKKRVKNPNFLQQIGPDFGPAWTEILDRNGTDFSLRISVMTSVQPGPKP